MDLESLAMEVSLFNFVTLTIAFPAGVGLVEVPPDTGVL
jgi:hypothetical protein